VGLQMILCDVISDQLLLLLTELLDDLLLVLLEGLVGERIRAHDGRIASRVDRVSTDHTGDGRTGHQTRGNIELPRRLDLALEGEKLLVRTTLLDLLEKCVKLLLSLHTALCCQNRSAHGASHSHTCENDGGVVRECTTEVLRDLREIHISCPPSEDRPG